jgi:hypothetical protein
MGLWPESSYGRESRRSNSPQRTQLRISSVFRQIHIEPTGDLRRKSTVCGLNGDGFRSWLHLKDAGSPMHPAESSSTWFCLWTGLSLPAAPDPASRRRSCLPLRTGQCCCPMGTSTPLLVRTLRRTSFLRFAPSPLGTFWRLGIFCFLASLICHY